MARLNQITVVSFVGNPGCIRFPQSVRKVSGIKRDDTLAVSVTPDGAVILDKSEPPGLSHGTKAAVSGCSCASPPGSCSAADTRDVRVGWSYVQLPIPFATSLGLVANAPIRLIAERSRITVAPYVGEELAGMPPVRCPP